VTEPEAGASDSRWAFIRDVVVFQLKLVLDALRDAALIPASIAAAVVDLASPGRETSGHFYRVVSLGRRTEVYIDLFEAADRVESRDEMRGGDARVDEVFHRVEALLREQEGRGGLTASARERVDRLLDAVAFSKDR
jgi:hypothetical protein